MKKTNTGRELQGFIDRNRQTGSTTSAMFAAALAGAYYIVPSRMMKETIIALHPKLDHNLIITLDEIKSGKFRASSPKQMFLDASLLCYLAD